MKKREQLGRAAAILCTGALVAPPIRDMFRDLGLRWGYMLLLSFCIAFFLTPLCARLACRLGVLDAPDVRKSHPAATPLLGGVAVFFAFLAAIAANGIYSPRLGAILGASALVFCVGLSDDVRESPVFFTLAAQMIGTAWVAASGVVLSIVPDALGLFADGANILLTFLWIIGITNAMNFFDGMDGLAAGLGAIIAFFLGIVAFQTDQPTLGWVAVAMLGGCLGFMPYNFRANGKALIFLGDAGSTVIGFVLACIAVYGDWSESSPVVALASPLLIFWVLIFDMVHISLDRFFSGKVLGLKQWIDYVGKDHLHHRIAYALGGEKRSVLFIYLMTVCLGSSAVLLRNANTFDALILVLQALILVVLITILERRGRTLAAQNRRENGLSGDCDAPSSTPEA
jgi:UDP-GlcNAc:undecaprenyl-phosphate GlcNAc-1-phosphate transferase